MPNTAPKEPYTRPTGKKRRSLLTRWVPGETAQSKYGSPYLGLPAGLCGIPNYGQYRVGTGADLGNADLSYADLRWHNFRGANLKKANLVDSVLWGSSFARADLTGADLSHADLTGADLTGANLTDITCEGACFVGARYSRETIFPREFGRPADHGMLCTDDTHQAHLY